MSRRAGRRARAVYSARPEIESSVEPRAADDRPNTPRFAQSHWIKKRPLADFSAWNGILQSAASGTTRSRWRPCSHSATGRISRSYSSRAVSSLAVRALCELGCRRCRHSERSTDTTSRESRSSPLVVGRARVSYGREPAQGPARRRAGLARTGQAGRLDSLEWRNLRPLRPRHGQRRARRVTGLVNVRVGVRHRQEVGFELRRRERARRAAASRGRTGRTVRCRIATPASSSSPRPG